jgi:REP-associated tyrosine transposase
MKQRQLFRGGPRAGAGRPAGARPWVPRVPRPSASRHAPLHVTLRARPSVDLRRFPEHAAIRESMQLGRDRFGFHLVHYSIQKDHLHLIAEVADRRALSRGMQGLAIRLAKAVNRVNGERGRVFADRYHARALRTPREVRNALAYVLNNRRRHLAKERLRVPTGWLDPLCSGAYFDGWATRRPRAVDERAPVVAPRTWLLRRGWRRHGPIPLDEIPALAASLRG